MSVSAAVPAACSSTAPLAAASPGAAVAHRAPIRVGLLGVGNVGEAVPRVALAERDRFRSLGLDLLFVGGLVRDVRRQRNAGGVSLTANPSDIFDAAPDVIVEALGGTDPARELVLEALSRGIAVVTANKTLVARHGAELEAVAHGHGAVLAFEAAVVAGVPFVGALARRPLLARPRRIAGILNGTSNFLLTEVARGLSFDAALETAIVRGFAEPDSDADLSGRDASEKLTILLRLAGYAVCPDALPACSLREIDRSDLALASALGGTVKPVALASFAPDHTAWIGPAFVPDAHPFARIDGSTNTLALTSASGDVVRFTGPGAGPEITAATLLDDVVEVVRSGRARAALAPPDAAAPFVPASPFGSWFITVAGGAIRPGDLAEHLFTAGLPTRRFETAECGAAALTWPATQASVRSALDPLRGLGLRVVALPVFEADSRG